MLLDDPFAESAVSQLPKGWLAKLPGQTLVAANAVLLDAEDGPPAGVLLDRHVVNLTLGWLESRPDAPAQVHTCAINLTAASLVDEGFGVFLYHRVRNSRVPAFKLCFEVTETSAVRDLARAHQCQHGVHVVEGVVAGQQRHLVGGHRPALQQRAPVGQLFRRVLQIPRAF